MTVLTFESPAELLLEDTRFRNAVPIPWPTPSDCSGDSSPRRQWPRSRTHGSRLGLLHGQLFFEVCAMKVPTCGTTFVLLHFGHLTFAFSRSEMVMVSSKGFGHFWHRNS
jgi:hypothetical protein